MVEGDKVNSFDVFIRDVLAHNPSVRSLPNKLVDKQPNLRRVHLPDAFNVPNTSSFPSVAHVAMCKVPSFSLGNNTAYQYENDGGGASIHA